MTPICRHDRTGFERSEIVVTTDWLAEHLDDPTITVLDVTGTSRPGAAGWNRRRTGTVHGRDPRSVRQRRTMLRDASTELGATRRTVDRRTLPRWTYDA